MTRQDRKFCGSIGVRFGTKRTKIELSPAENHGGPSGLFRVRVNRRWYDMADGRHLYLAPAEVAALAAELATGGECPQVEPPMLPVKSRVIVPHGIPGGSPVSRGYTATDPILGIDGTWYVAVVVYGGVELHPVNNLTRC